MPPPLHFPELQTVDASIAFHAARTPDRVALHCAGAQISYAGLHAGSRRSAQALLRDSLGRGARVAYLGKETIAYYDLLFACAQAHAVLVPINWRLAAAEVDHVLRDSGSAALFIERAFMPLLEPLREALPALQRVVVIDGEAPAQPGEVPSTAGYDAWRGAPTAPTAPTAQDKPAPALPDPPGPDDALAQIYTSGTTGLPKGVVLAHRSLFKVRDALASQGLDWIDWHPGDVNLVAVPGFHIGGLWCLMQGFNAGITNVAMRMFVSSDAVALIRQHRVTVACMVPSMIQMCLAERGVGPDDFASLRKVIYGGSPIAEVLLERGLATMRCQFAQIYGLTETGNTAVCLPPAEHVAGSERMQAAGRPYPGFEVKVIDRDGSLLGAREIGEVCIHSPARMLEYWGLPEATERTLVDGWIHTGDAGFVDEAGFVYIRDRIKDMIIVAGEKVYPAEVENAIASVPAVAECAVIGVPDARWGEGIAAYLVLREGYTLTPRELLAALKGRVADFKLPTQVLFTDRIPRNPSGKVLRRELRDQHWAHMARQVN